MMTAPILFEERASKDGKIGIITLNRPAALNALNFSMCTALQQQLNEWAEQDTIKAAVIQGAGERAFCAGGDIRVLYQEKTLAPAASQFFRQEYITDAYIANFPKPSIALLHGIVMGGGAGISITASHRLAAENLIWAMPETGIGFFPDVGVSYFLARCPGKTGLYLALTGARLNAADTVALDLADAVIPQQRFTEFLDALLMTPLSDAPHTTINKLVEQFAVTDGQSPLTAYRTLIDSCFAAVSVEAIIEALQQQSSLWAQQTAQTLLSRSPTSLKVTHQLLQKSAQLTYEECLEQDYRVANHFISHPDFHEGIRTAVIDKTHQPQWSPARLQDVSANDVAAFFAKPE